MKFKDILLITVISVIIFVHGCASPNSISPNRQNILKADIFKKEYNITPKNQNIDKADIKNLTEEEFKNNCIEIIYNDLNDEWIGKYVTKEILFTSAEQHEYQCASTESYIEDLNIFQHVYTIYDIYDCRFDKSFPIYSNDVIRIYGIITGINTNYANGLEYPIIDMYYADFIREWRQPIEEARSMDELIQERNAERERIEAEKEYYNSLNSDYTGQTKNVDNMDQLNEEDFKTYCDSMNFKNMFHSSEDLSGRYVKMHIQLTTHKVFKSDASKRTRLNNLVEIYSIDDNIWYGKLFLERTGEYGGNPVLLYFADNGIYDLNSLKENQTLVVYGLVMNYEVSEVETIHNKFDFLVVYIE